MNWKKVTGIALISVLVLGMLGCGSETKDAKPAAKDKVHLTVFAAASMTETMNQIAQQYQKEHPDVEITYNFDSSGTLKKQIQNGAECDVFISAAQKQMNQLDVSKDAKVNPEHLDFIDPATRLDLLENKVVLVTPEGNPKDVKNFSDMADKLRSGSIRLVMGNSDVPVGQYTQKILKFFGLDEQATAAAGHITYGSNVKEVTTQVLEGSADCGVIYATDAYSAKLTPVDQATKDMCGQVIYPAAVLKSSKNQEAAKAFLQYLQSDPAMKIFENVGFSRIS
ncbi:molybdenum ABC transporter substrate-binding protein [Megasphaera cerevisiae DSM 20462]|jgi:molybdate transport system substrate-binding protein|uniref:Molybdate-binding protein ModA n=1 Tax=Megasphaera cerevisiae DSM 20462 TaxID=1122219 RepID=A0A0J6ZN57_9FIRM|nr:molybdate ABC transporter substrate-binding protein [Megasphaera cerevisiae]KMO86331.1 molybdenum ABC transporter substrate-binding protein [Megasphaera cerevisiae DSM 20462]OKY53408.1 molybdate ABC transporter substrate-binding protein [Megasphaera cerevisiae]SJZ99534.1 molybdate transport system substrate-binding protein [Megasphaera cerevisiae DSM 20462]